MLHQSMSGRAAQARIDEEAQGYARMIADEQVSLEQAHALLSSGNLDLFQTAGLAKAIACFQCTAE